MHKKQIKNLNDFYKEINTVKDLGDKHIPYIENCEILFKLNIPIDEKSFSLSKEMQDNSLYFENCSFPKSINFKTNDQLLYFKNCEFYLIDLKNVVFKNKIRFHKCHFHKKIILNNITFQNLADFWSSTFNEVTIFYKVNFENTTVFSSAVFKKNTLFTFSKLSTLVIIKGTVFEQGLDLSTAIIEGKLSLFNIKLADFKSKHISSKTNNDDDVSWLDSYDGYISDLGIIPTINKRETYRMLKEEFENLKNIPESLRYKVLEHRVYRDLLGRKEKSLHEFFDWLNLWLNDWSSIYGTSYLRAFLFTILIGLLFFNLSLISTDLFAFSFNPIEWEIAEGAKYFVQFLIPTHKFDYLGNKVDTGTAFYILDFVGRLLVGYGIYQFIQAFRKYK